MADHGNKCNVPGCAGDVKCRDGLVSVYRKPRKANKARVTKGTWLAASCTVTVHTISLTT